MGERREEKWSWWRRLEGKGERRARVWEEAAGGGIYGGGGAGGGDHGRAMCVLSLCTGGRQRQERAGWA